MVALATLGLLLAMLSGCAVPQRPGRGQVMHRVEPEMKTGYWLYLPEDYITNKGRHPVLGRWPVVLTLHGMNPYDTAHSQIREWQEEADRYGFIVIAPELRTCTSLMQYPLSDPDLPYVRQDSKAVLLVMDEVFRQTNADPGRVLITSFSCGGYLAHYFMNRYPERFSCLAVRGSNFNAALLQTAQIPKYRHKPMGIFFGENDFHACAAESIEAVRWYRQYNFPVEAKEVRGLGHERRPQLAAALFARTIGLTPKTPPDLASLVLRDVPTPGVIPRNPIPSGTESTPPPRQSGAVLSPLPSREAEPAKPLVHRPPPARPASPPSPTTVVPNRPQPRPVAPTVSVPPTTPTPKRPVMQPYSAGEIQGDLLFPNPLRNNPN